MYQVYPVISPIINSVFASPVVLETANKTVYQYDEKIAAELEEHYEGSKTKKNKLK